MIYDGITCTKQMVDNKQYLEALNVLLPDYFEKVQHYLDCAAYDMEYDFPFLYEKQQEFAVVADKCSIMCTRSPGNLAELVVTWSR